MKTKHQERIEEFMVLAGQDVPETPIIPDEDTRILRAKLIIEEALETVHALGVKISSCSEDVWEGSLTFKAEGECDIIEVVDGCLDVSVVSRGTLSAFGVSDEELLEEVDNNNLAKFGPGGYRRDDGKWVKPPTHQPPDIKGMLEKQGYKFTGE
jgi:predicted HAD superfamily Cof-like phosphohydrolase